jgi:hypothetical protein
MTASSDRRVALREKKAFSSESPADPGLESEPATPAGANGAGFERVDARNGAVDGRKSALDGSV